MTHSAILLALDALAVYRLTRLVVADTITARAREAIAGRRAGHSRDLSGMRIVVVARPRLAALVSCPWCVSPYLAVLVVCCQALIPALWIYPAAVLAFSAAAGLISEHT